MTDFTLSSSSFISCEPFDTQNDDISLVDHSASSMYKWGDWAKNLKIKEPNFLIY